MSGSNSNVLDIPYEMFGSFQETLKGIFYSTGTDSVSNLLKEWQVPSALLD